MSGERDRTGQCLCGAVRFTAHALPATFGVCHCKMCQRWAGSALMAVTIPISNLTVEGADHIGHYQSSSWAERTWCTTCGSGLWYKVTSDDFPPAYEIPIGLLDDADGIDLTREIFIDRKPDGYAILGDHERLTEAETLALYGMSPEAE
jgi:hypothetical protein